VLIVWESLHQGDLRKWHGIAETGTGASAQTFTGFFIVAGSQPRLKFQKQKELISMTTTEANPPVRTVASTQSEMTEVILPNDANTLGNLLGGRLMHFIDVTGAIAAYRHSRTHVVTAAMDHIDFIQPVHVGDLLILKSSVNRAFNTSLEVGVKVWVEDPQTGTHLHVASAYLVFVAVDEHGRRQKVPQLQPETPNEIRRYNDALLRREHREKESARRKQERHNTGLTRV
jgi:acyl-CoA hydrolase